MCRDMAKRNGVSERVQVRGTCTAKDLDDLIIDRTLVISDCEGFEVELLDLTRAPALATTDLIVELHDFVDPTISATIIERFAPTHNIEIVDARPRNPSDYPILATLTPKFQRFTLNEGRPTEPHPMQWAVITSSHAAVDREP